MEVCDGKEENKEGNLDMQAMDHGEYVHTEEAIYSIHREEEGTDDDENFRESTGKGSEAIHGVLHQPGVRIHQQFTDETAACMIVADDIYVMLPHSSQVQGVHSQGHLRLYEIYGSVGMPVQREPRKG